MHQPVQPKSLSWWGEVGNSLIFQHSPSRGGSLRPQTWSRSEQQLFYLIALTRILTRDLWLWYHIELHAPTSSTQKLLDEAWSLIFQHYTPTISIYFHLLSFIFLCWAIIFLCPETRWHYCTSWWSLVSLHVSYFHLTKLYFYAYVCLVMRAEIV